MLARLRALLLGVVTLLTLGTGGAGPRPAAPLAPASPLPPGPADAYIHVSNSSNTLQAFTDLESLALNGNPNAMFLAINQLQPEGGAGDRNDHPPGLFYDSLRARWAVYNDDLANMANDGLAWNVFLPAQDEALIVHTSAPTNTIGARTTISATDFNSNPSAILFAEHEYVPGVSSSANFPHTVAVTYDAGRQQWAIVATDGAAIPPDTGFFVWRGGPGGPDVVFQHTSSAANRLCSDCTAIDNPAANNQPDALLIVTPFSGSGGSQPADTHPVGVWYDSPYGRWTIFNEDGAPMTSGLTFNVAVIPPQSGFFLQTVTFGNRFFGQISLVDDARLNNHPEARLYVSHNWNPPDSPNDLYNDHPIGARYFPGLQRWYVCNLDGYNLPIGATFNVYFTWPRANSFKVAASSTNTISAASLVVNNPVLNGNAGADPIVTNDIPTEALCGPTTYGSPVGVVPSVGGWGIFNDTGQAFPPGVSFDVLALPATSSFEHFATAGNTFGDSTVIDNPLTNGDPWAMVFPTPRDNGSPLNDHNLGVWYNRLAGRWEIFNEDQSAMPTNTAYDVFVIKRRFEYLPVLRR